ncbi:MAG TPA: hypothetical protein GX517_05730 [Alicyclobacillus sp.]|nr:hypothetical protein [Alicyclobacillus sp.]
MKRLNASIAIVCISFTLAIFAPFFILKSDGQQEETAIVFGELKGSSLQSGVTITDAGQNRWILYGNREDIEQLCHDSGLSYMMGNIVHVAGFGTWTTPPRLHTNILHSVRLGDTNQGVDAVRDLYHIPRNVDGSGSAIALVTIGYPDEGDIDRFADEARIGYTPLSFFDRPGSKNHVSENSTAVYESSRMIAPRSRIFVYSAEDTTWTGLTYALLRALGDSWARILVIPWSVDESSIPQPILTLWHDIFESMKQKGVVVIAAAGDRKILLPTDDQLNYPASDPLVISVGVATRTLNQDPGAWPGSRSGISNLRILPNQQPVNGHGPNVVMIAAPDSGGTYWTGGRPECVGGSAIAAAMFGGVMADLESQGGLDSVHFGKYDAAHFLETLGRSDPQAFTDVRSGIAAGYAAAPGNDLATGWGLPNVEHMLAVLRNMSTLAVK